jgi:hypothetical protein
MNAAGRNRLGVELRNGWRGNMTDPAAGFEELAVELPALGIARAAALASRD